MSSRIQMIVNGNGEAHGYAIVAAKRWGCDLLVYGMELAWDMNLQAAIPSVLRALQAYGMQLPAIKPDTVPLREISFSLGRTHPVYDALGQELAPLGEPPFAWYVRVPDLPAFIRHIAPVLERRLASSVVARYTGELKLDFYRDGLRMVFDRGHLTDVEPWGVPVYHPNADAGFPALVFTQLLFGYRSLDDLRYAFPDVRASSEARILLNALFPVRPSWVMQL